ncbi:hypothetical protein ANCCAN_07534 [Ancylostoma caninum]|uniref:Uncharacterized protein n=1 Tax=Ancylostoma caninum TaxID=29170 RepID=A0A368GQ10_ANCCA|nr:hypothetical protein ANCCAN_07534 [Ancylostoma caninum]
MKHEGEEHRKQRPARPKLVRGTTIQEVQEGGDGERTVDEADNESCQVVFADNPSRMSSRRKLLRFLST